MSAVFLLSGCSLPGGNSPDIGSVLKTTDGGQTWEPKVKVNEKQTISAVDVLSMAIDSNDSQKAYVGTEKGGLFVTKNGGENWEKLNFPTTKIYGLAVDRFNPQILYATGVWQKRGKIYKSENGGADWGEIYTEPAEGTVVSSLEISKSGSQLLYAGTSDGMVMKTSDGGKSWKNLYKAKGPIIDISFDSGSDNTAYFAVFNKGILRTKNGGASFDDLTKGLQEATSTSQVFSLAIDPGMPGVFYAGLDKGFVKGINFGDQWEKINILESSKKFPIRAVAVNPQNPNEIIYAGAQALYKSIDGGVQWSTFQLDTSRAVQIIKYDPLNPGIIYLGLRKL